MRLSFWFASLMLIGIEAPPAPFPPEFICYQRGGAISSSDITGSCIDSWTDVTVKVTGCSTTDGLSTVSCAGTARLVSEFTYGAGKRSCEDTYRYSYPSMPTCGLEASGLPTTYNGTFSTVVDDCTDPIAQLNACNRALRTFYLPMAVRAGSFDGSVQCCIPSNSCFAESDANWRSCTVMLETCNQFSSPKVTLDPFTGKCSCDCRPSAT